MGLLGLLMPVPQAAALIALPSLITNVWQAWAGSAMRALLARFWSMQAGIVFGVAVAAWLPAQDDGVARVLLGGCLLGYGLSGLAGWRLGPLAAPTQRGAGPVAGAVTGMITAVTGVFVLPAVPYLQSLQMDRQELARALGLSFTTSTLARAVLLAARGQLGLTGSLQSALFLVPALAGMLVGQKLRDVMSDSLFRQCFHGGLMLLGGWLVAW
jgi:hypothetical protein